MILKYLLLNSTTFEDLKDHTLIIKFQYIHEGSHLTNMYKFQLWKLTYDMSLNDVTFMSYSNLECVTM